MNSFTGACHYCVQPEPKSVSTQASSGEAVHTAVAKKSAPREKTSNNVRPITAQRTTARESKTRQPPHNEIRLVTSDRDMMRTRAMNTISAARDFGNPLVRLESSVDNKVVRSFREENIWRNKTSSAVTTNFETAQEPTAPSHTSNASPRKTWQDRHQQHCRTVNNLRPVGTSACSSTSARKLSLGLLLDTSRCRLRKN